MRALLVLMGLSLCAARSAAVAPVNSDDARLALKIVAGLAPSAAADVKAAEVASPAAARDGRLDLRDVVYLLRAARGGPAPANAGTAFLTLNDHVSIEQDATRTYVLARAFRFAGTLRDENGNPVSGWVDMRGPDGGQAAFRQFGNEGRYAVGLRGDTYRAQVGRQAQVKDPVTGQVSSVTVSRDTGPVAVGSDTEARLAPPRLPPLGVVEGDFTGEGFIPQTISAGIQAADGSWATASGSFTGRHYRFQCPAGTATLSVHGKWPGDDFAFVYADGAGKVVVHAGETAHFDFAFPPLVPVTGSVSAGGARVQEVHYRTPFAQGSEATRYACGLAQNDAYDYSSYTIAVPPGRYEVNIHLGSDPENPGLRRFYREIVDVPAGGGKRDFHLPETAPLRRFSGRVVDPSGRPLANARLMVAMAPWNEGPGYQLDARAQTDAGGSFSVLVPAGAYYVMVEPPPFEEPAGPSRS